jgi:hypothetical protein
MVNNNDMNEKTLTELKAAAYDAIAQKEYWQNELNKINQAIAVKIQEEQEKRKVEAT